jgi:hypothetical protein
VIRDETAGRDRTRPGHPAHEHGPRTPALPMRAGCVTLTLLALACLGMTACGAASQTTASSTAQPALHAATAPAADARANGIRPPNKHVPRTSSKRPRRAALPPKPRGALANPRYRRALATFAACMRRRGVHLPPPNTTGRGPIFPTNGIDVRSPGFKTAIARCRDNLTPASGR